MYEKNKQLFLIKKVIELNINKRQFTKGVVCIGNVTFIVNSTLAKNIYQTH